MSPVASTAWTACLASVTARFAARFHSFVICSERCVAASRAVA